VTRSGDLSSAATVDYASGDITASERTDYETAVGTLTFAAGESSKSFLVLINYDSGVEGNEFFSLTLSNPTGGTALATPSTTTVQIIDSTNGPSTNAIDNAGIFVCQQYHDFLNRDPDPPGLAAWTSALNNCPAGNTSCDRIAISSAFFTSDEFHQRGLPVYLLYETALGRKPTYLEFIRDLRQVTGFLTAQELTTNQAKLLAEFMSRQEFRNRYDSATTPAAYVDALALTAGVTLANRNQLVTDLTSGSKTRADVLLAIAQGPEVQARFFNKAWVVMEYFGYLRRNPDALYLNWVDVLNQTGNSRGLVGGFLNSTEYRNRFGP
jgi:Calx-beta domain